MEYVNPVRNFISDNRGAVKIAAGAVAAGGVIVLTGPVAGLVYGVTAAGPIAGGAVATASATAAGGVAGGGLAAGSFYSSVTAYVMGGGASATTIFTGAAAGGIGTAALNQTAEAAEAVAEAEHAAAQASAQAWLQAMAAEAVVTSAAAAIAEQAVPGHELVTERFDGYKLLGAVGNYGFLLGERMREFNGNSAGVDARMVGEYACILLSPGALDLGAQVNYNEQGKIAEGQNLFTRVQFLAQDALEPLDLATFGTLQSLQDFGNIGTHANGHVILTNEHATEIRSLICNVAEAVLHRHA